MVIIKKNDQAVKRRLTPQRKKILEYLRSVTSHPTAETVFNAVKEDMPMITLATVYRNLNLMAEEGTILRLEINNEYHFDGDISDHQHCFCSKCGTIFDNFEKKINSYAMNNFNGDNGSSGFVPTAVHVTYYGLCSDCSMQTNS